MTTPIDMSNLSFHPTMEKLVDILRKKTQNEDPVFFRLMVSYYFCKLASMMRCNVEIAGSQLIPINMYAINLAPSGSGKGHSISIIEESVISNFRNRFLQQTFPKVSERNLRKLAIDRARRDQVDPDEETTRVQMEFDEMGPLLFAFDSGTTAAVKQMRTKLLMARAGSMNLEIDEIGSNLLSNNEVLNTYLELFDLGKIKQKLVKNTRDNQRSEDLFGITPTNMLLFGTPTKLLNGSRTEEEFYDFLDIGYARRCFFGHCRRRITRKKQTATDLYKIYNDSSVGTFLAQLNDKLGLLADPSQFNTTFKMQKDVSLALLQYQLDCQAIADTMSEFEEVKKAEVAHRYFKVAKLAGAYAFVDGSTYVTMQHLENAIAMAEQSGAAFTQILSRDKPYVKLAHYLASIGSPVTHADLVEALPFYGKSQHQRTEQLNLATAHGYRNGIFIRRDLVDGIEFLSGKSVPATDMNSMIMAVSVSDVAKGFSTHKVPFAKVANLVGKRDNIHWVNHSLKDAYRSEEHVIPGFNMVVLDVDGSVDINTAKMLLKDYTYLIHTTKSHTAANHRYRIIIPISHVLELDGPDFRGFMHNIYDWLPFEVDRATAQRSRKWLTCKGKHWYNDGELLDALQFVPKTKRAEEQRAKLATQTNFNNLERWFINNTAEGNRNQQLIKYAYALLDMNQDLDSIRNNVLALNSKLDVPLDEIEVLSTVIASVTTKYSRRIQKAAKEVTK